MAIRTTNLRVLALTSQKGGSGKTMLAAHLAVQAEQSGAGPVAVLDIDPDAALSDWHGLRSAGWPAFVQTSIARMLTDLDQLRADGIKLVIIDTPSQFCADVAACAPYGEQTLLIDKYHMSPYGAAQFGARLVVQPGLPFPPR